VSLFLGRITDAIVQQEEIGGRAFFRNEGKTHNDGAEIGVEYSPIQELSLRGAYTRAHYRFVGGNFDGNRLPGVPDHFWRFGLRTTLPQGFFLDADHTLTSSLPADDANTIIIESWGAGVTNLRVGWDGRAGVLQLGPFLGVNNLWDRQYIGSVTLNGAGGRVLEPSPRRVIYVGAEIGYAAQ
jgi:iron complex outermembrane receptor protein